MRNVRRIVPFALGIALLLYGVDFVRTGGLADEPGWVIAGTGLLVVAGCLYLLSSIGRFGYLKRGWRWKRFQGVGTILLAFGGSTTLLTTVAETYSSGIVILIGALVLCQTGYQNVVGADGAGSGARGRPGTSSTKWSFWS